MAHNLVAGIIEQRLPVYESFIIQHHFEAFLFRWSCFPQWSAKNQLVYKCVTHELHVWASKSNLPNISGYLRNSSVIVILSLRPCKMAEHASQNVWLPFRVSRAVCVYSPALVNKNLGFIPILHTEPGKYTHSPIHTKWQPHFLKRSIIMWSSHMDGWTTPMF